ncbi:hypothetical protein CEK62_04255 [Alcanivorax sp. N3-2A]|nr:hypothetical protein CEK62_04255 [Alcanivorax sp. N3-2A]
MCRLLRFPFSPCLTTISLAESHVLALLSYREGMPRTVLGRLHGPPRQTLLTAGRAARQRIEAQFDERIVVEAALGLVQD